MTRSLPAERMTSEPSSRHPHLYQTTTIDKTVRGKPGSNLAAHVTSAVRGSS